MFTPALAQSTESDGFECLLCLEHLYQPSALPCGHIYCGRCVTVLHKLKQDCPMKCPIPAVASAVLPQVKKMLEVNDHKVARLIDMQDQVASMSEKIEELTKMLVDQDHEHAKTLVEREREHTQLLLALQESQKPKRILVACVSEICKLFKS